SFSLRIYCSKSCEAKDWKKGQDQTRMVRDKMLHLGQLWIGPSRPSFTESRMANIYHSHENFTEFKCTQMQLSQILGPPLPCWRHGVINVYSLEPLQNEMSKIVFNDLQKPSGSHHLSM